MNKPEAILIIGFPGSGKTHLAKTKYSHHILIDDPSVVRKNFLLMMYHLNITKWNLVITDPPLCNIKTRRECVKFLKSKGYKVKCIYFENDEKKCKVLLKLRNDNRIINSFKSFKYTIPKKVKTIEIYSPKL